MLKHLLLLIVITPLISCSTSALKGKVNEKYITGVDLEKGSDVQSRLIRRIVWQDRLVGGFYGIVEVIPQTPAYLKEWATQRYSHAKNNMIPSTIAKEFYELKREQQGMSCFVVRVATSDQYASSLKRFNKWDFQVVVEGRKSKLKIEKWVDTPRKKYDVNLNAVEQFAYPCIPNFDFKRTYSIVAIPQFTSESYELEWEFVKKRKDQSESDEELTREEEEDMSSRG